MENFNQPESKPSERIQDIIQKLPTQFSSFLILSITFLLLSALSIGWFVKWPETIVGEIEIISQNQPISLVSKVNGKLLLLVSPKEYVKANQYIAYIKNTANYEDVIGLKSALETFEIRDLKTIRKYLLYSHENLQLGEVQNSFSEFIKSISDVLAFVDRNEYDIQLKSLKKLRESTQNIRDQKTKVKDIRYQKLQSAKREFERDSLLLVKKAIIEVDFEKTRISLLNSIELYQNTMIEISDYSSRVNEIEFDYSKILNEKLVKSDALNAEVISHYENLRTQIRFWEERYAFISPIDGQLEYLQFWNDERFISPGEQLFSVVPEQTHYSGQLLISTAGAGKIKQGQRVHIKLENYPYKEYGIIEASIKSISIVPNQGIYLLTMNIGKELVTNRKSIIQFQYGMKGIAEVITKEKTLLSRIFESMEESFNQSQPLKIDASQQPHNGRKIIDNSHEKHRTK
ncbi:MAG: HlyD family efflux transporter periplasmic adaptor subunit [Cytophagales bacterium]|jgi:hypothetical protein|nr:HlyD family efflux transporter periplasmic adaptor subunit [Cytophagales bacterium]MCA6386587.1 HlyD family efflux transporter periplasmic adaptor subunit [Cytophagales bacterium]MCA6389903.1 HlyD family efflux transporter periplasmic adaptor subunit [Cytophagales bacterium]MCA6395209.1 HlyD family efflux transporter periplasmic adaptor subunit [Cytophagales bacterium]MCA6398657.1 HlyD family efflux transporter periplasmic adaptor subunit [Cytophagales bacterium]